MRFDGASELVSALISTPVPWGQKLLCSRTFWISPRVPFHLAIHLYLSIAFVINCWLSMVSKPFPELCEPLYQITPKEGLMRPSDLQPVGQKHK